MRTLERRCDSLVSAVKAYFADKSVVFIHAFSVEKIQNPPDRYLISVSYDEVSEQGFVADRQSGIVSADLAFRVYAPRGAKGEELYGLCALLSQTIRAQGGTDIGSIKMSKTCYDTAARTVCRDIRAQMSYPKGASDE